MKPNIERINLTAGVILITIGLAAFIETFTDLTSWGWILVLVAVGIFSGVVNWSGRSNLVTMIPSYILWSIAGLILITHLEIIRGEAIAFYVLFVIGLPFAVGWYLNKSNWGLLIPAYVLFTVGLMVWLIGLGWLSNLLVPAYVMFAIALPFFVVYKRNPQNWWALIPGGIMGIIGISFLLATRAFRMVVPIVIIGIGIFILVREVNRRR